MRFIRGNNSGCQLEYHVPHTVELVEAMATFRAIHFAKKISFLQFVVEGDWAIDNQRASMTMHGHLIEEIDHLGLLHTML